MFFLKKLLQYIEQKGFRAGTGGADKRSVVIAAPTKPAGRAVRRENGEQGFAGNRRGRVAAESVCAAGGDRRAEAERFAWYFAVRGFFARSAREKGNSRVTVAVCRRGAGSAEEALRAGQCLRGSSLVRREAPLREGARSAGAVGNFAGEERFTHIFAPEFFADLASLRGLNVEERRGR